MTITKTLLYLKVKEDIEQKITARHFNPGDRLPSEPELAKEYHVSRPTLREALKMLQKEGKILSKNGVGTYIHTHSPMIENPLNKLQSLGEMIKNAGYLESEANVDTYHREPDDDWKEKLGTDGPVVVVERTRTADNQLEGLSDPTTAGGAYIGLCTQIFRLGEAKAWDFYKKLKQNTDHFVPTAPGTITACANGEFVIGISWAHDIVNTKTKGYPVEAIVPKDTACEIGSVSIVKNGPNTDNAKKFVDWLLTKEAGELNQKLLPLFGAQRCSPTGRNAEA